jgi:predicted metalloprotease
MRWIGRRQSGNVEDRRGQGGGGFGGGLGGMGGPRIGLPRRASSGGGIGIVGILIILGIMWLLGVNPLELLSGQGGSPSILGQQQSEPGQMGTPTDEDGQFVATVLADTEDAWNGIFQAAGRTYREPTLVLFRGTTQSACGFASAASGPFYCPGDQKLYIDLAFYDELQSQFQAPGDFAEAYVLAHEVGHHVQNLLGTLPKVHAARQNSDEVEANQLSIRLELQADCYAGIWAHEAEAKGLLDVGDIDEALTAAAAVGDDTIQMRTRGYVVPESFNHGTAEQRSRWFKRGYSQGDLQACDTFGASQV